MKQGNAWITKRRPLSGTHRSDGMKTTDKRLSMPTALFVSTLILSMQLLAGKVNAQIAHYIGASGSSTAVTYSDPNETGTTLQKTGFGSASACGSGGLSGMTVNTSFTTFSPSDPHVYFTITPNAGYVVNVTGISAGLRRSGTGPAKVRFAYSTDGGSTWTDDGTDHAPNNGSCGSSATGTWGSGSLPTGASGVIVALFAFNASNSSGTFQVNDITVNGSVTLAGTTCSGTPAAGTVSASPSSFCGSGSSALSLTPGSSGSNLTFQWSDGSGAIAGATNSSYTTPTISATATYSVVTTCPTSGMSSSAATTTITVNPIPSVASISPSSATINTTVSSPSTQTFTETTTGGTWSSSSPSIATIGSASGVATATNAPGTTTISYTVNAAGCFASATATLNTVAAGTLATYTGTGGSSTSVTAETANETAGALTAAGFGTTSPCTSGGLSGITVNTVYATYTAGTNPHVYFQILPNAGFHLNITAFRAITRESGTGPTEARLSYSLDGGATWTDNGSDIAQSTTGSCGGNANIMSWAGFTPVSGDATNGIIVAVYPFAPTSNGGTFQVNNVSIDGTVTADGACSGIPLAGTVSPAASTICGGSTVTLSLTGGSSFTDQTYQWLDGSGTPIPGATNASYTTAVVSPTVTVTQTYSVTTTCIVYGSATSAPGVVTVNPTPDAGTITGASSIINTGTVLALTDAVTGGVWSSSNTSVAFTDLSGNVTGTAPGSSIISYSVTALGCTGVATYPVTDVTPGNLATYTGTDGSSTFIAGIAHESVSALAKTGFGSASPCVSGGLSGMTVSIANLAYNADSPRVYFQVTPDAGYELNITGFSAITRESGSGPTDARLAYSLDGGATWIDDATDHVQLTTGSCGANTNNFSFNGGLTLSSVTGTIYFAVYPYAPSSNSGTFQVNSITINGSITTTTACSAPVSGTAVATLPAHCGSGSSLIALSDGPLDAGIQYQWFNTSGSIAGATNATFTTPVLTASETYSVVTTCPGFGSASSSTATVTINALPNPGTITGTSPIPTGSTTTYLSDGDTGGTWSSNNSTVATIGSLTGVISATPVPGSSVIRYTVTASGCSASSTATLNTVPMGTLATYIGTGGSSTTVTPEQAHETIGALTATGFGVATACTTGGLSGITVNTVNATYNADSAHVYFQITPDAGYLFNVTGIRAITRESGTGPTLARFAYSLDGGATWVDDGTDHTQLTTGSCGGNTNIFGWNGSLSIPVLCSSNGIIIAIYPYAPGANTGTFQVQSISVDGSLNPIIGDPTYGFSASDNGACPNNVITLSDAVGGGLWSDDGSGNAIALDEAGDILGVTAGTTTISYTLVNEDESVCNYATAVVTVTDGDCSGRHAAPAAVVNTSGNDAISLYPNPATSTLNINASQKVNVSILSIDGKVLIDQKDAVSVDISNLETGLYIIRIYNQQNTLVKTAKFNKIN